MDRIPARLRRNYRRSQVMLYSLTLPLMVLAMTFGSAAESTKRMLLVLIGFSSIVFIHELGHFVVARLCSVKCEAFAIGIGPRLLGWRQGLGLTFGPDPFDKLKDQEIQERKDKIAESTQAGNVDIEPNTKNLTADILGKTPPSVDLATLGCCDYRISMLPLGGYVRMLGQDDMDPTKVSDDPNAYNRRPIWQRMCIISAGVIMNVICAAVIFSIVFHPAIGVPFPPAIIGHVYYGSPAYADGNGLKMGDKVISIDRLKSRGFVEFTDLVIASALSTGQHTIEFEVQRPGVDQPLHFEIQPKQLDPKGFLSIGVEPMPSLNIPGNFELPKEDTADEKDAQQRAQLKKLMPKDRIIKFNGEPVETFADVYAQLQTNALKPVVLTVHNTKDASIPDREITLDPKLDLQIGAESLPLPLGVGPRLKVGSTVDGGAADKAGVKPGDIILSIGNRTDPTAKELSDMTAHSNGDPLELVVERDGKRQSFTLTPVRGKTPTGEYRPLIGVRPDSDMDSNNVVLRDHNGLAANLDVFKGGAKSAQITAIDGQPVKSWNEIVAVLRARSEPGAVNVTFKGPNGDESASLPISDDQLHELVAKTTYRIGLPLENIYQIQKADSAYDAVMMGMEHTKKFIIQTYMTLAGIMRSTVSATNLHGPVVIAKVGYDVQERGFVWLCYLMAVVSVNLAVANFLPLPVVDGGHFLLLILEKIRGRPLSLKTQTIFQTAGVVLLAGLFLFVTFNDITYLFSH